MTLIPKDKQQAHRLKRVLFGCLATAVVVSLLLGYYLAGMLGPVAFVSLAALSATLAAAFYALIRLNLNRDARDPSLTFPMILASLAVILVAMSQVSEGRSMLAMVFLIPFMFGVFRLSALQMLGVAALFQAGQAWILWGDWQTSQSIGATRALLLEWFVPAVVLCWFALFAGYVGRLRKRLADSCVAVRSTLEQVQSMVSHDELTGLYSRRYLMGALDREVRRSQRAGRQFCVLMLDLDRFKNVNDTYGHAMGDDVLRCFAKTVQPLLRPEDVLGRFGGEEFLIVSGDTALQGARVLAERIRAAVEQMSETSFSGQILTTVSIGVSQFESADTIESLIARADQSLYAAKKNGRNRVEVALELRLAVNR